ncbi:MAG TPA: hydrogen peroxide-inducible genes activator [Burkholderiales bacterium]|jgi:LysR family hydrogen peroxide-inducible transcriptional activator|nr:hydrogen peroxide-inducible genes activator [Burkholderiales bacterium]
MIVPTDQPPMINALPSPRQLRYLVALSETLNFRRAAERLFVTQSTLSAGIKELETLLGTTLVERDKRSVRLTAIGEQVVERARKLLAQAEDLVMVARGAGQPLSGLRRLGVIPTVAPFLLPAILPVARTAYPKLQLYLREDLTDRLLQQIESGDLDFALIALPYDTGDLVVRTLFSDEFWFVAREDDALARLREVAVRQVEPNRILLLEEGHCLREHAIEACGARRMSRREGGLEATSLYTLLQMVESGLGVTLLPEMVLKAGVLNGTRLIARPFSVRVPARTIALAMRRTSPYTKDFDLLCELIIHQHREATRTRVASRRR